MKPNKYLLIPFLISSLLSSCTKEDSIDEPICLNPNVAGISLTRAGIENVSAVSAIGIYAVNKDNTQTSYGTSPAGTYGKYMNTASGFTATAGEAVWLCSETAMIFSCHPASANGSDITNYTPVSTPPANPSDQPNPTIPIPADLIVYAPASSATVTTDPDNPNSLDKDVTFDGSSTWDCSATDYLYGSNTDVVELATPEEINAARILANNKSNYSPSIYLHHALAQVEFRMKKKDGLANEYDYVKKITITAGTGQPFRTGTGSMLLTDGTIADGSMVNSLSFIPAANAVQCGSTQSVKVAFGLVAPMAAQPGDDLSMTIVFGKADLNDSSAERELTVKSSQFNMQWKKGRKFVYNLVLTDHAIEVETTGIESWTQEKNDSAGDAYPDGFKSIN